MSKKPHPALSAFLELRKAAKLKTQIKETIPQEEQEQIRQIYEETFDYQNWISKAAPRANQISITTHPSKFSNPDAGKSKNGDTSSIIAQPASSIDGYLRSGNTQSKIDAIGNAAALDVYEFLHLEIEGRNIIQHLQEDSEIAKQSFSNIQGVTYEEIKASFLEMIDSSTQSITSEKIKQVYFPVVNSPNESEGYHLLSLISNSGLIYEMRSRLDQMHFSDETKELKEHRKKATYSEKSYSEVYNLITLGYGGTKPQNISVLNSKNGGRAYLLSSRPPHLEERATRFPTKDFFSQCVRYQSLSIYMKALHAYYRDTRNNIQIRAKYEDLIESIIENLIISKVWQLREVAEAQYNEHISQLPAHQKIWLTGTIEERFEDDQWLSSLVEEIATWLLNSYRSVIGEEKFIQMSEAEHDDLEEKISSALKNKENLR